VYKTFIIKPISRFLVLDFFCGENYFSNDEDVLNINKIFWDNLLNESFIKKISKNFFINGNFDNKELDFITNSLSYIKSIIDFQNHNNPPSWSDIIFSYKVFNLVINHINRFIGNNISI